MYVYIYIYIYIYVRSSGAVAVAAVVVAAGAPPAASSSMLFRQSLHFSVRESTSTQQHCAYHMYPLSCTWLT